MDDCCDKCCDSRDVCCWLLCLAAIAVIVAVVVLAVAFGVVRRVTVTVDNASLTRFVLATSPTTSLAYNLSLTLTVRNPNWAMSIAHTKPLDAAYLFDGQGFDRVQVVDKGYKQGAGKTDVYRLTTGAESAYAALGNAGVVAFKKQSAAGVFELEVNLSGEIRYQAHFSKCKLEASCPLKLQLAPPGTSTVVFRQVKCKVAKPDKC